MTLSHLNTQKSLGFSLVFISPEVTKAITKVLFGPKHNRIPDSLMSSILVYGMIVYYLQIHMHMHILRTVLLWSVLRAQPAKLARKPANSFVKRATAAPTAPLPTTSA